MRPPGTNPKPTLPPSSRDLAGPVRRSVAACLLAFPFSVAGAMAGDDGPDLSPPLDAPASPNPPRLVNPPRAPILSIPAPAPVPVRPNPTVTPALMTPSPSATAGTAVLAVPGLAGPVSTRRPSPSPLPEDAFGGSYEGGIAESERPPDGTSELTLDGPIEMPDPAASVPRVRSTNRAGVTAIPNPIFNDRTDSTPFPDSITPRSSSAARRIEPALPARTAAPARRGRFFGLFPGPVVVPPTALNSRPHTASTTATRDHRSTTTDPDPPAAAEAALKARIEKQARTYVGDRARSIEVHVDQKTATIQARGVKFYQKRAVRKSLEFLPALTGLRSTIEVMD